MSDAILRARIDALDDSLRRLLASVDFSKRLYSFFWKDTDLWAHVSDAVDTRVKAVDKDLDEVRAKLDDPAASDSTLREAWNLYARAQERSADLFRGCLEFIGGVAFRGGLGGGSDPDSSGKDPHEKIWLVADQLMRDAARDSFASTLYFLTVPAFEEALCDSLARTVRLRFPEWNIWTLPLLAYDFGHVAIERREVMKRYPLRDLVKTQTNRLVEQDENLRRRQEEAPPAACHKLERGARKLWQSRVRILLADAFATYMMGPAYACAAIHLRFDPSAAYTGNPSYDERARVVVESLRQLDREDPARNEHERFINDLEGEWRSAVEAAEPPDPRDPARETDLKEKLLPAFEEALKDSVSSTALYSKVSWARAVTWRVELLSLFASKEPLKLDLRPQDKLRDVLNAAWLCRMEDPKMIEQLTRDGPELCLALLAARREVEEPAESGQRGVPGVRDRARRWGSP